MKILVTVIVILGLLCSVIIPGLSTNQQAERVVTRINGSLVPAATVSDNDDYYTYAASVGFPQAELHQTPILLTPRDTLTPVFRELDIVPHAGIPQEEININSMIGKKVEFTSAAVMTASAQGGAALRYPYRGHVTTVLGDSGDYIQIQFGRRTGWVPKSVVQLTNLEQDYIRLSWQFVSSSNSSYVLDAPDVSGYNVYAPVMYGVGSNSLYMINNRNFGNNISIARQSGYKVWLTIQQFGTSPNFKDKVIDEIINVALLQDVDGINIDFEGMGEENRDGFTAFMTRLYPLAKDHGFVVSLDVTRHAATRYGLMYDRAALAKVSDYIALMAYDEHWSTSPLAGSVASMPWVESSIRLLLNEVPAEKVLLGIPLYTRNWRYDNIFVAREDIVLILEERRLFTQPTTAGGPSTVIGIGNVGETFLYQGTVIGESNMGDKTWFMIDLNGKTAYVSGFPGHTSLVSAGENYGGEGLSSYAIPTQSALDIYANYDPDAKTSMFYTRLGNVVQMRNVDIIYDEAAGQNLATYIDDKGRLNKVWLEDYISLIRRRRFMDYYNLAGVAAWSVEWMDTEGQLWNHLVEKPRLN